MPSGTDIQTVYYTLGFQTHHGAILYWVVCHGVCCLGHALLWQSCHLCGCFDAINYCL